jgi:hypothetical protein
MKTLPRVGERTMAFAHVLLALADGSNQITVSDDVLVSKSQEMMDRLCGPCAFEDGWWKNPDQAVRDALQLLERLDAIEFERRKRGRRTSSSTTVRTITLNLDHFLWSVLASQEVQS